MVVHVLTLQLYFIYGSLVLNVFCCVTHVYHHIAVRLAIETRDEFWENQQNTCVQKTKPLVAAALGPYGAYLADGSEYSGDYMDKVTSEVSAF